MFTMETLTLEQLEKHYHHGDLRNALVQAGLTVLAEEGVERLNLREVARRVGVSHAAPYRHFADKEALLAAIAEDGFRRMGEQLVATLAGIDGNWAEKLQGIGRTYLGFAQENRDAYRLMFSHMIAHRDRHEALHTAAKASFDLLANTIHAGQRAGEFVAGDTASFTISVWSMMHGLASLLIEEQLEGVADRLQSDNWQEEVLESHVRRVTASLQMKS
ncbi:MAG: TetR/AcrR family transcriptional regulator [Caldilineaceae bacterium]